MKNLCLTFILITASSALFAQEKINKRDITIHIRVDGNWGDTDFVDISKKSEKVTISSPKLVKMRSEELHQDTGFLNLQKNHAKYPMAEGLAKLKEFYNRYSTFDTTTVVIDLKADRQYSNALKLIASSSKAKLEKNHEIPDSVMDASNFTFTITTDNNTKNIYAKGLFDARYPILANFLNLTYARLAAVKQK